MSPSTPPTTGRPRDPDVDARIAEAVLVLYGERGWSGFSVEAVASRARVGKASIYRRWTDGASLLSEVLAARFEPLRHIDHGSVREDLVDLATRLLELYGGEHGRAARRMAVEAETVPEIARHWDAVRAGQVRAARAVVRRATERGDLLDGVSTTLLLDLVCGASIHHFTGAGPGDPRTRADRVAAYASRLVDLVLRAVAPAPPHV